MTLPGRLPGLADNGVRGVRRGGLLDPTLLRGIFLPRRVPAAQRSSPVGLSLGANKAGPADRYLTVRVLAS